jgi:hypothetical protein
MAATTGEEADTGQPRHGLLLEVAMSTGPLQRPGKDTTASYSS